MSFFSLIKEKGMIVIGNLKERLSNKEPKLESKNVPVINEEVLKTCIGTRSVMSGPAPHLGCPDGYLKTELICKGEDGKVSIYSVPATFSPKSVMNSVYGKEPENFHVAPRESDEEFLETLKTDPDYTPVDKVGDMRSFAESFLGTTFSDWNALKTYMDPALIDDQAKQDISLAATTVLDNHFAMEAKEDEACAEMGLQALHVAGADQYVDNIMTQCEMLEKMNEQALDNEAAME